MPTISREELQNMCPPPAGPTLAETQAIELLLTVAESDTGQSKRCRSFLLAWWNPTSFGGLDPTDLWGLDEELAHAATVVFALIGRWKSWPTSLPDALSSRFRALAEAEWEARNG